MLALSCLAVTSSAAATAAPDATDAARSSSTTRAGARPAAPDWLWPIPTPIRVVGPFVAPATAYSAGHRGIDLSVSSEAPVSAPADGVVAFAGQVAGRPTLAIDHGDGVRSAIEPVHASVVVGDVVVAGELVGRIATGGHCDSSCAHFGVRVDGEYVSPFLFLGGLPHSVLLPLR